MIPENKQSILMDALNMDDALAQALIASGLTTVRVIADAPTGTIASINGLDESMEAELHTRAHNWLAQHPQAAIEPAASDIPARRGRGRPATGNSKVPTTLRLERETLSRLRATGAGWQVRAGQGLKALLDEGRL